MTGGQVTVPLVVRTANGGGLGFGAQHSQATENWAFTVPGLKIAAPSTPADVVGLMASAIRSDDPVVVFEHKGLFASKGPADPPGRLGMRAAAVRGPARGRGHPDRRQGGRRDSPAGRLLMTGRKRCERSLRSEPSGTVSELHHRACEVMK